MSIFLNDDNEGCGKRERLPQIVEVLMKTVNPWPVSIVVFFIALAIGNFWLLKVAQDPTDRSLPLSSRPYEDGLAYQKQIEELKRFAQTGWQPNISVLATGAVSVCLTDRSSIPVSGLKIKLQSMYAASAAADANIELQEQSTSSGCYSGVLPSGNGFRLISLLVEKDGAILRHEERSVAK